jgi:hypothetical protein
MIKVSPRSSGDSLPILKNEPLIPTRKRKINSIVNTTLSLSSHPSNPFPSLPIGPSLSSLNPFPTQETLPLPDKAGFQKKEASKKRKGSLNLLPAHKTHSPRFMDKRKATSRIKYLFTKPVHSFRIHAAKIDRPETREPDEHGEIHCNGRTWRVHETAGKGPRVYPKRGPGIYTFSGKELELVFNEFLALRTPMKFEEFLIQRDTKPS